MIRQTKLIINLEKELFTRIFELTQKSIQMKNYRILILVLFLGNGIMAQTPQLINYQCVVRDATGLVLTNQSIGLQISILEGNINGTPIYRERQFPSSNQTLAGQ